MKYTSMDMLENESKWAAKITKTHIAPQHFVKYQTENKMRG